MAALKTVEACLNHEEWETAESLLSDFFVATSGSAGDKTESASLGRALQMQAHLIARSRISDPSAPRKTSAMATSLAQGTVPPATVRPSTEMHVIDLEPRVPRTPGAADDTGELNVFTSAIIPLQKALNLAINNRNASGIYNASLSFLKLSHKFGFRHGNASIDFLRALTKTFGSVAGNDQQPSSVAWQVLNHVLLAQFLMCDESKDTASTSKARTTEARANMLQASKLVGNNVEAEFVFLRGMRAIIRSSPKAIDAIEPRWMQSPALKALVMLDNGKTAFPGQSGAQAPAESLSDICQELLSVPTSTDPGDIKTRSGSGSSASKETDRITVPLGIVRLLVARKAISQGLFNQASDLIARCPKDPRNERISLRRSLLEAEVALYLQEQQQEQQTASDGKRFNITARLNSLQNVARVIDTASSHGLDELVVEGGIVTWNLVQPILDNEHRHLIVGFLRNAARALEGSAMHASGLEFFVQHELARCYEVLNLLSLAQTHAAIASGKEAAVEDKGENEFASLRVVAKLHSMSTNLSTEIKALTLVDRAKMASGIKEAAHFLQEALKIVLPACELGTFASKPGKSQPDLPQSLDKDLLLAVMVDIMREAHNRGQDQHVESQAGSQARPIHVSLEPSELQKIGQTVWEIAHVASTLVHSLCTSAGSDRKRLVAEAHLVRGESVLHGLLSVCKAGVECARFVEAATGSFLAAIEIGRALHEQWIVYNASGNIWNMFVVVSSRDASLVSCQPGVSLQGSSSQATTGGQTAVSNAMAVGTVAAGVATGSTAPSVQIEQRQTDVLVEIWADAFQKLVDVLAESSIRDTTLYAQICSGLSTSMQESPASLADAQRNKAKPNSKDASAVASKSTEEILKSSLTAKHADYNSLLVGARAWCKIQAQKTAPAGNASQGAALIDTDDPVLRLFASLELSTPGSQAAVQPNAASTNQGAKTVREPDVAVIEHNIVALKQIKLAPDVFRVELWLRIGKQAAEFGHPTLALGCLRNAAPYIQKIETTVSIPSIHLDQWLVSARLMCIQLRLAPNHSSQIPSDRISMSDMAFRGLQELQSYVLRIESQRPQILKVYLRILWNAVDECLTKRRASIILGNLVGILKSLAALLVKNAKTKEAFVGCLDSTDFKIIQDLFIAAIDICIDQERSQVGLRLADWGMRILPAGYHHDVWFRKAYILYITGRNSSLIPLKDDDLQRQALTWQQLAEALPPLHGKQDAFNIAQKILSAKHLTDTWTFKKLQSAQNSWMISAGYAARDTMPAVLTSAPTLLFDEQSVEKLFHFFDEQLSFLRDSQDQSRRNKASLEIRRIIDMVIAAIFQYCKPVVEPEKDAVASGGKGSAPKARKPKEPVQDALDIPTTEKWHLFIWPAYIRTQYVEATSINFLNKSTVKAPLAFCSKLLEVVVELVQIGSFTETHPIFALMELVSELSSPEMPDLQSTVMMYYAVVLSLSGLDKRAQEKYRAASQRAPGHREDRHTALSVRRFPEKRQLLNGLHDVLLLKAECHIFFQDYTECLGLLSQAIRLGTFFGDLHGVAQAHSLRSMVHAATANFEAAHFSAGQALRICTNSARPTPNEKVPVRPFQKNARFHPPLAVTCATVALVNLTAVHGKDDAMRRSLSIIDSALESANSGAQDSACRFEEQYTQMAMVAKLWVLSNLDTTSPSPVIPEEALCSEMETAFICARDYAASKCNSAMIADVYMRYLCFIARHYVESQHRRKQFKAISSEVAKMLLQKSNVTSAVASCQSANRKLLYALADVQIKESLFPEEPVKKTILDLLDDFLDKVKTDNAANKQHNADEQSDRSDVITTAALVSLIEKLPESSEHKAKTDYYVGMCTFLDFMSQPGLQDDQRRQLAQISTKRLSESMDSLVKKGHLEQGRYGCEALLSLAKYLGSDGSALFRFLAAAQACDSLPFVNAVNDSLSPPQPIWPDFTLPGWFIPSIQSTPILHQRRHDGSFVDDVASTVCRPLLMQLPEWPKDTNLRVIILQHSIDGKTLYAGMASRQKDTASTKGDRKKTPSDEVSLDFEVCEHGTTLKDLSESYKQLVSTGNDSSQVLSQIEETLCDIIAKFRREDPMLSEALSTNLHSTETSRPKSNPKDKDSKDDPLQPPVLPEEEHLAIFVDSWLDPLPLEILLQPYFRKACSVSRDFNLHTMLWRHSQREAVAQKMAVIPEPPTKKKEKIPDADKDKALTAAISYVVLPRGIPSVNIGDGIAKLGSKASGLIANDVDVDEMAELFQRGAMTLYCGPTLLTNGLHLLPDLRLSNSACLIFDFPPNGSHTSTHLNPDALRLATILTLQGASSVLVPYRMLTGKQAAQNASRLLRFDLAKGVGAWLWSERAQECVPPVSGSNSSLSTVQPYDLGMRVYGLNARL
ncbi:hypothetical protein BC831DRAFT_422238 [Entophlyctis helioformis]|nr:hypothetical protein BC831DRAFT_422238 [Entophlyctis helioformis]